MTFDWVEVVWNLLSLAVLGVTIALVGESHGDVRMMKELGHQHGRRWLVAWGTYRRELVRMVIQFGFLFIGIVALVTPPQGEDYGIARLFSVIVFLAAQVGLLTNAILDYRLRWQLRLYEDKATKEAAGGSDGATV